MEEAEALKRVNALEAVRGREVCSFKTAEGARYTITDRGGARGTECWTHRRVSLLLLRPYILVAEDYYCHNKNKPRQLKLLYSVNLWYYPSYLFISSSSIRIDERYFWEVMYSECLEGFAVRWQLCRLEAPGLKKRDERRERLAGLRIDSVAAYCLLYSGRDCWDCLPDLLADSQTSLSIFKNQLRG